MRRTLTIRNGDFYYRGREITATKEQVAFLRRQGARGRAFRIRADFQSAAPDWDDRYQKIWCQVLPVPTDGGHKVLLSRTYDTALFCRSGWLDLFGSDTGWARLTLLGEIDA